LGPIRLPLRDILIFKRFDGNNEKELLANILKNQMDLNFKGISISDMTKDLLKKMLTPDPAKRIEWADLFCHPALN